MAELEKEDYIKLLELLTAEEQFNLREHQLRIQFYFGIISTLLVATIVGVYNAKQEPLNYLFLLSGPVLIIVTSALAKKGTKRMYQRFLDTVTQKAKIEGELSLTEERNNSKMAWGLEPIIPTRHIKTRKEFNKKGSEEFIEDKMEKGYSKWTIYLFNSFIIIGAVMFCLLWFRLDRLWF